MITNFDFNNMRASFKLKYELHFHFIKLKYYTIGIYLVALSL